MKEREWWWLPRATKSVFVSHPFISILLQRRLIHLFQQAKQDNWLDKTWSTLTLIYIYIHATQDTTFYITLANKSTSTLIAIFHKTKIISSVIIVFDDHYISRAFHYYLNCIIFLFHPIVLLLAFSLLLSLFMFFILNLV